MSAFPATRLRRLRRTDALRGLVRETRLDLDDFVMPLFAGPSTVRNEELPGMSRYSVEDLVAEAAELAGLGVKALLLFGVPDEKDDEGSGAWDEDGIVQRSLRALRADHSELVLVTDVCLCEYTSHGHCGVIRNGEVANDETLDLLARKAFPLQSDNVEAAEIGAVANRHAERDDVGGDAGHAADKSVCADTDILVHGREPTDDGAFADRDMAAQGRAVH